MSILTPHFDRELSFDDYLKSDGISNSALKYLLKAPKLFKYFILEDNQQSDTPSMQIGRAFHTLVLEPHLFKDNYYVTPKIRKSGASWEKLQEEAQGKSILWEEDYNTLKEMEKSLRNEKDIQAFLEDTETEVSMFWTKNIGGKEVNCRGRVDAVKKFGDKVALIDLKTTTDASNGAFPRQVFNMHYDMQAAYYMDGYKAITGKMPELFIFIAIEKNPPYLPQIYYITSGDDTIEGAREEYTEALVNYVQCEKEDNWEIGYGSAIHLTRPFYK
jgi:exodeoxyribonuclease VIII